MQIFEKHLDPRLWHDFHFSNNASQRRTKREEEGIPSSELWNTHFYHEQTAYTCMYFLVSYFHEEEILFEDRAGGV